MHLLLLFFFINSLPLNGMQQAPSYPIKALVPMENSESLNYYSVVPDKALLQSKVVQDMKKGGFESPLIKIPESDSHSLSNLATFLTTENLDSYNPLELIDLTNHVNYLEIEHWQKKLVEKLSTLVDTNMKLIQTHLNENVQSQLTSHLIASKQYDSKIMGAYVQQMNELTYISQHGTIAKFLQWWTKKEKLFCYFNKNTNTAIRYTKQNDLIKSLYIYTHKNFTGNDLAEFLFPINNLLFYVSSPAKNNTIDITEHGIKTIDTMHYNSDETVLFFTGNSNKGDYYCIIDTQNNNSKFFHDCLCCFNEKTNELFIAEKSHYSDKKTELFIFHISTNEKKEHKEWSQLKNTKEIIGITCNQNSLVIALNSAANTEGHCFYKKKLDSTDSAFQPFIIEHKSIKEALEKPSSEKEQLSQFNKDQVLAEIINNKIKIYKKIHISNNSNYCVFSIRNALCNLCTIYVYNFTDHSVKYVGNVFRTANVENIFWEKSLKSIRFTQNDNLIIIPANNSHHLYYNTLTNNTWHKPIRSYIKWNEPVKDIVLGCSGEYSLEQNEYRAGSTNSITIPTTESRTLVDQTMTTFLSHLQSNQLPLALYSVIKQDPSPWLSSVSLNSSDLHTIKNNPLLQKILKPLYPHITGDKWHHKIGILFHKIYKFSWKHTKMPLAVLTGMITLLLIVCIFDLNTKWVLLPTLIPALQIL